MSSSGIKLASPAHEVAYADLVKLVSRHAAKLSSEELLAVAANMLGKLVALQDQRTMTIDRAMEIVSRNIQYGNSQVIEKINASVGHA